MARTLVLGGGFGGITVATELKRNLGPGHDVTLVDRGESFAMGLRKLWELVGHATIADGTRALDLLASNGIEVVRGEIESIDPKRRSARVDGRRLKADYLVVALGAEQRPDLVEGLAEHGHDVWSAASIPRAAAALREFAGGRIVVLVSAAPYPCPPAPFECALHLDESLRQRGVRERSEIVIETVQPILMPNAGEAGSAWLASQLEARDIGFEVGRKVSRVEPGVVSFEGSELAFDLLFAVPPHRAPEVVRASGLTGPSGWIEVDRATFRTGYENVFAVGDVTQIVLANGLPLPKAGVIAELEALRVADAVTAAVAGREESSTFDGVASCFIEMGTGLAARVDGEWYAEPAPRTSIAAPSAQIAEDKRRFERDRLERWFGG